MEDDRPDHDNGARACDDMAASMVQPAKEGAPHE